MVDAPSATALYFHLGVEPNRHGSVLGVPAAAHLSVAACGGRRISRGGHGPQNSDDDTACGCAERWGASERLQRGDAEDVAPPIVHDLDAGDDDHDTGDDDHVATPDITSDRNKGGLPLDDRSRRRQRVSPLASRPLSHAPSR